MLFNCYNMAGNITIYAREINNFRNMLYGKYNNRRVNIFVPNGSNTNTYMRTCNGSYNSVAGAIIYWTTNTSNNCFYNAARNIYVYWKDF